MGDTNMPDESAETVANPSSTAETVAHPSSTAGAAPQLQTIPVDKIDPSPYQVRQTFDEDRLRELANSMQEVGLLQPIVVRPMADRFQVVAGERRLRAAKLLGWTSIPALVEEMSDLDAAIRSVVENEQRQNVQPLERARAFKRLNQPPFKLTQEEIAKRVGFSSRAAVSNVIALLDEPPEIQEMLSRDNISAGHVHALQAIEDEGERTELAKRAANRHWSVRETEKRVRAAAKGEIPDEREPAAKGESAWRPAAKGESGWRVVQHVLQVLRAIPLVQRLVLRAMPLLERFVKWILDRASRLVPGHEDKQLESGPSSSGPPDSNSSKAA